MKWDENIRKKWSAELFPNVDWDESVICERCYANPPVWTSRYEWVYEFCSYCGNPKDGGTIAPREIPELVLERLMKERIW